MALRHSFRLAFFGLATFAACTTPAGDAAVATTSAAVTTEIGLIAPGARACELVLSVDGVVAGVSFPEGVAGSHFRRAPRLGVSLTSLSDAPLPAAPLVIDAATSLTVRPETVRCVDRLGQPISGAVIDVPTGHTKDL